MNDEFRKSNITKNFYFRIQVKELHIMKLTNFETNIDSVIVKRGKDYFKKGHVESIEEIDQNYFIIDIVGTDDYTVEVTMNDADEIVSSFCNCPYDWGDYCKHEVAAFYALREENKTEKGQSKKVQPVQTKKKDVKSLISGLNKNELIKIILNLSKEFPEIEKKLLFTYSASDDEIASSKKLISEYMHRYMRRDFIEWDDVDDALQGAYMTLEKVNEKLKNGELESAILLSIIVLSHVVDMLGYCDDSSGIPGAVIEESLDAIQEAVSIAIEYTDDYEQEKLFTILLKESENKLYEEWVDWKLRLLRSCSYFCNKPDRRKKFEDQLTKMSPKKTNDSWSEQYGIENIKLLQLEVKERYDGAEKALQFIRKNINLSPFREKAILYSLRKEEYPEVITLCEEGKKVDKEYRGLVHQWETYELEAYEGLGDVNKQRELILAFLYKNDYTYYSRLKALYKQDEWKEILPVILETFEKQTYLPNAYIEILKEEKLNDKLIEYCKRNVSSIKNLYPQLVKDYFNEVNELFQSYIQLEAEQSNNRSKYQHVCSQIKLYKKVCGDDNAQLMIDQLKQKYPRRPAFLDELGRIQI